MPNVEVIIGGAGTGKTTRLLDIMLTKLNEGIADPFTIGFISFTRAARWEAACRAGLAFDQNPDKLLRDGWFKTLHSCCYHLLKAGKELLTDDKESREWLQNALQFEVSGAGTGDGDSLAEVSAGRTDGDTALALWHVARNRLCSFREVWERAEYCDERTPSFEFCESLIKRYEQQKRFDRRLDFTDLLGRYSGWWFGIEGHEQAGKPDGMVPNLPVWFLDEAQDNSPLTDSVARRLTSEAEEVYLVGDPFQAIYGWAGADPHLFTAWTTEEEQISVLPKSHRCPPAILELGENCLKECSDYWDREIKPADKPGSIEQIDYSSPWPEQLDPRAGWLLLARTNFLARRLGQRLDGNGIPWAPIKGNGGWNAPQRLLATRGLHWLSKGEPITADEWRSVLKQIPSRHEDVELLTRGTKSKWEEDDRDEKTKLQSLDQWGATPELVKRISEGRWLDLIDKSREVIGAAERWGWECLETPKIRVGTFHGAKGMEEDNVLLLTTTSHQVERSREDPRGADEERRLSYVGVTRSAGRLLIAEEMTRFKMEIPYA